MKYVRIICVSAIIILYLLGAVPAFMGFYNRLETFFGIPIFAVGIIALSLGMLLFVFILYRCESARDDDEGGQ